MVSPFSINNHAARVVKNIMDVGQQYSSQSILRHDHMLFILNTTHENNEALLHPYPSPLHPIRYKQNIPWNKNYLLKRPSANNPALHSL